MKINIRIPLSPSYFCEVCDYRKATVKSVQKAIQNFDWEKAFGNFSVERKVDILNKTLMNNFRNYIPNKKVKCNYYQPLWINDKINKCLRERSKLTEFYYKHDPKKK